MIHNFTVRLETVSDSDEHYPEILQSELKRAILYFLREIGFDCPEVVTTVQVADSDGFCVIEERV